MDKILKELTCSKCNQILSKPVLLPCGHSACQSHIKDLLDDKISCFQCGKSYQRQEFPLNQPLANLISAEIVSIDFGQEHREAKEACKQLQIELNHQDEEILNEIHTMVYENI